MITNNGLIGYSQHKEQSDIHVKCVQSHNLSFSFFLSHTEFSSANIIMAARTDIKKVVILGGGAAGLLIAMKLGPEKKKHGIDVTLVDCKVGNIICRHEAINW